MALRTDDSRLGLLWACHSLPWSSLDLEGLYIKESTKSHAKSRFLSLVMAGIGPTSWAPGNPGPMKCETGCFALITGEKNPYISFLQAELSPSLGSSIMCSMGLGCSLKEE